MPSFSSAFHRSRRDASEIQIRFALLVIRQRLFERSPRLLERRLGLANLLVDFRRLNFGHGLARTDAIADVDHPLLDVAVGAGQDRRFGDRLNIPRQFQFALGRRSSHLDHFHPRQGLLLLERLVADEVLALPKRYIAREEANHDEDNHSPNKSTRAWSKTAATASRSARHAKIPGSFAPAVAA